MNPEISPLPLTPPMSKTPLELMFPSTVNFSAGCKTLSPIPTFPLLSDIIIFVSVAKSKSPSVTFAKNILPRVSSLIPPSKLV